METIVVRAVLPQEIDRLAEIEAACFPPDEAASKESLNHRFATFPENFLVAEADGQIVGFINGCTTNSPFIYDELYHDAGHHQPNGLNLSVFGLDVTPEYQHRGFASLLMEQYIEKARREGRKGLILSCKDHLIHYYETFGFVCTGLSESTHGGAAWYDMTLSLS